MEKPRMLPKTSESSIPLPSFAGCAATNADTIYEPSVVSEAALVRMVMQALQGSKVALDDIDKISASFCLTPADTTVHRVPNAWQRSSSVASLGKLLVSFGRAGRVFLFLHEFVDYFLIGDNQPPHSLVNQAFAVAVRTLLEGYICALNTLSASVKLRRSINGVDESKLSNSRGLGNLTSVVDSDITVLEVYLHTKELRIRFEVLGNICCFGLQKSLVSVFKALAAGDDLGFDRFLRGADLLTYLYLQLRDSDPVHQGLLKFLFTHSWAPYYSFIKSWIYKAQIDDPHQEFVVDITNCSPSFDIRIEHIDDISLASVKERNDVSVPCFLQDVCLPLFRTGQQLHVLIKLLEMCNCPFTGDESNGANACNLASYEDVLPFWTARLGDSWFCLSSITFCRKDIRKIMTERDTMYTVLLEKLKIFFKDLNSKSQLIKILVNSSGLIPHFDRRIHSNSSTSTLIEGLDFSGNNYDNEAFSVIMGLDGTEISSTSDDSFNEQDLLQFSELSSVASSEDIVDIALDPDTDYAFSNLSKCLANQDGFERMYEIEKLLVVRKICNEVQNTNFRVKAENENINLVSECLQAVQNGSVITSDSISEDYHSLSCWPLGGLLKNPFLTEEKHTGHDQLNFIKPDLIVSEKDVETLERGHSHVSELFIPGKSKINPAKTVSDNGVQSWISTSKYDLNRNPMLSDIVRLRATCNTKDRIQMTNGRSNPYFDFSLVMAPHKVFLERSNTFDSSLNENLGKGPWDFGICDTEVSECDGGTVHLVDGSDSDSPAYSSSISHESILEKDVSEIVSGGSSWEVSLRHSGKTLTENSQKFTDCSSELSEIPLDIIVDRCILQEILLQYKYVSNFTIKLLDEGFGLREHLMALRRYHFIELGDWADSFIMSLWNHKWRSAEAKYRIAELQSLLDVALQRSSCEGDPFWKRLFVYTKEQNNMPLTTSAIGVLDIVLLGYKIDWPVNIVVTSEALNIYADIFSFLMQIRLALYSLSHMWQLLKDLGHSKSNREHASSMPFKEYNTFMKIRLQVNHFVSTLQQYVQSQLSDVSCCRFLHSLKHEVKDMLDLESMHMLYLADSLNICFLSTETQAISSIIKSILQCALNFHSCINRTNHDVVSAGKLDSTSLLAEINFPQVLAIKATFERSVNDLYKCYLKSPKHCDSGVCSFWCSLNFNDYYSKMLSLTSS